MVYGPQGMKLKTVIKRSGMTVPYDRIKIRNAIKGANSDAGQQMSEAYIDAVTGGVEAIIAERESVSVEDIQDVVEQELMKHGFYEIAKKYIKYRQKHAERREAQRHLMESYRDIFFADSVDVDLKRDNANINTDASMGIMLKLGAEGAKHFVDNYVLDEEFREADRENYIHIHDKDFSLITFNCMPRHTKLIFRNYFGRTKFIDFGYFDPFFAKEQCDVIDVRHCKFEIAEDGRFVPISKIMRRRERQYIYKLTLKSGIELEATQDHVFKVLNGNGECLKNTRELVVGDELPLAKPAQGLPQIQEVNLISLFGPADDVMIANPEVIRQSLSGAGKSEFYFRLKRVSKRDEAALYARYLSLREYYAVREWLGFDEHKLKLACSKGRNPIPAILPASRDLGKFMGYVFTEGYVDEKGSCLVFANRDEALLEDFRACTSRLFPEASFGFSAEKDCGTAHCHTLRVFGKILVKLFRGVLASKHHSNDIMLGDWAFSADSGFVKGLLAAEIDGDGSVDSNYVASVTTVSRTLAQQLQYLAGLHGLVVSLSQADAAGTLLQAVGCESYRRHDSYRLSFRGSNFDDLLDFAGDCCYKLSGRTKSDKRHARHDGEIVSIEKCTFDDYVYDFETESHYFNANGVLVHNCCQIDLLKLFHGGFSTGHGFLREPNSIRAYASLACIAIQSNQNDMFGGQSINCFDYAMAEGVKKSFRKAVIDEAYRAMRYRFGAADFMPEKEFKDKIKEFTDFSQCSYSESREAQPERWDITEALRRTLTGALTRPDDELTTEAGYIYKLACEDVAEETHQAMEALIHNFNTLHSRAGAQVPFSSINYGMDTSPEGRLAVSEVLNAIWSGLGNGETAIFPISVFQIKAGVNYNPGDPNYDLFLKACKVSAKRLFPNFVNLDAPYNLQYYKPGDYNSYVATMGCRTRVMSNVNGPEQSGSRGNFAFTTINLPKLALEAQGDLDKFWQLFDKYIQVSHDYLLARLHVIEQKHVYNYPFLMGQGVWLGSEKLRADDSIKEVLKHASYSIGFCGLAECLVALMGKHHGESEEAQQLGLKIVAHLRERTDAYTKAEQMNWTTFGTPAESTAGQFQRANRRQYGVIKGVTDRDYMTNSSHVPVYYPIKAIDKIRIEAPYHALENAGHIAYIEMDGDPTKNVKAFEAIVRAMHDADMGYFSINHPVDRDPVCGYTGIIENECPHCHRREVEQGSFTIKRRKA